MIGVILLCIVLLCVGLICAFKRDTDGNYEPEKHNYTGQRNGRKRVSLRPGGYGEDKAKSYNDGYRQGMEDAIYGDRYRYTRGVKGSDSFKSGYQRGFEEYED